jgi:hypothetical protein
MKLTLLSQRVFNLVGLLLLLSQANSWAQCFQNTLNIGVGAQPMSVVVGDFNRDNKPDLAVANNNSNTVSVLLNDGTGGFSGKTDFGVGTQPRSVTVGDFNSDGNPDLVVANYNSNNVSVLLGNGSGGFGTKTDFAVGNRPSSVAVGDFNNDSKLDLITTNAGSNNVSVLLGNGSGGFGAAIDFGVGDGASPQSVALADFNDDGLLDIAVANAGNNTVFVAKGTGTGGFNNAIPFQGDAVPVAVVIADFNHDGKLDLAVANNSGSSVSVMLNSGFGIFPASPEFGVNPQPYTVAVGDFNGDGNTDLVSASDANSNVSVLLGDGTGQFSTKTDFGVGSRPQSVAVGDFNGDGKPDLVTANYGSNNVSVLYNCTLPAPTLSVSASPNPVCAASTVALSVTATGGTTPYNYTWAAPEGITLSATSTSAVSASVGPAVSGVQTVTVTVASSSAGTPTSTRLVSLTVNAVPTVTLTQSGTLTCNKFEVILRANTASEGRNTYSFSAGALQQGNFDPVVNSATVSNPGDYSVTVTSPGGCTATASTTVIGDFQAPQNVTLSNNGPLTCSQTSVTLTASSTTPGVFFSFPGLASSGGIATVNQARQYTVLAFGPNGCVNGALTTVESNTTAPTASLINNGPITCTNRTVTLTADGGNTYVFSNGATPNGATATVMSGGVYSVTVTGTNSCTATKTTNVASNTTAPTASLINNGPITCNQRSVTLTAGGGGTGEPFSYAFSPGATPSGNTATVMNEGPYSVTVTGTNGCTAAQTSTVTSNTTAPNASLSNNGPLTASNPTVTLTAGGGNTYAFSSGASQQNGGNTATVSSPGNYQVTVTNSGNSCLAIASTLVTGAVSGSSCRNGSGVISVVATGTPVKYEWYRNSINSARLTENPAQVRGTSTASLTLVNQQVTADYYVRVTDANGSAVVYGPFKMTVNLGCNIYARVGAEEVELKISVLGNPIQSEQLRATIIGAEGKVLNVQLLDLSGKSLYSQQWQQAEENQSVEWNLSGQTSGVYLLQAITPTQHHSLKVIKP